ncbi:radical SAM protein [Methylovirgula sp. 4M-Z18]|uniref:radical SAM protein n=1 Tax=Methylovirgula sp. 4M-Z18 TaxID=2293567 RepID=UPI000E2EC1E3|nr:radical SAM protein [Methylovirgula sp. 4M-Z18]RFB79776.1 radical SAM protein [Methylovirgula sp. 4M-Z18]
MKLALDSPTSMTIGLTETCPLRCRHCYADCSAEPRQEELSVDQWVVLLDDFAAQGVIQLYIEGGEPLAKPGLFDLLRAASPRMMTMMRTHGYGLDHIMGATLRDAGLGRALVDLMGACAETHDTHTGVPGSFAQACAAVQHLVACGIPTDALVILTRQTAPELQAILNLAQRLGASRVGVLRLYPLGRAKRNWSDLALPLNEQMAALAALQVPQGLTLMQSWHPKDRNCCWQGAAINARGRAIGCMYLREYVDFGDVTTTSFREIWQSHPLYRDLRSGRVDESCKSSKGGGDGSKGGCRSTAFAWSGSWTAPDPFDIELNNGVDLAQLPSRLLDA